MQTYFRLSPSTRLSRPLTIFALPQKYQRVVTWETFDQLDPSVVAYFSAEAREEAAAVLSEPSFLICDELKKLFELYVPGLRAKMIQLFAGEKDSHESYLYWLPYFPPVDCLHEDTERYPDGSVKNIVLDRSKIQKMTIFRVGGIPEYRIVVELSVAESILRRCPYGVDLVPVEVK